MSSSPPPASAIDAARVCDLAAYCEMPTRHEIEWDLALGSISWQSLLRAGQTSGDALATDSAAGEYTCSMGGTTDDTI